MTNMSISKAQISTKILGLLAKDVVPPIATFVIDRGESRHGHPPQDGSLLIVFYKHSTPAWHPRNHFLRVPVLPAFPKTRRWMPALQC